MVASPDNRFVAVGTGMPEVRATFSDMIDTWTRTQTFLEKQPTVLNSSDVLCVLVDSPLPQGFWREIPCLPMEAWMTLENDIREKFEIRSCGNACSAQRVAVSEGEGA